MVVLLQKLILGGPFAHSLLMQWASDALSKLHCSMVTTKPSLSLCFVSVCVCARARVRACVCVCV